MINELDIPIDDVWEGSGSFRLEKHKTNNKWITRPGVLSKFNTKYEKRCELLKEINSIACKNKVRIVCLIKSPSANVYVEWNFWHYSLDSFSVN